MKVIELSKGFAAIVDDEDFAELAQYRWHYCNGYAMRTVRFGPREENKKRHIYMHLVIRGLSGLGECDHRNGNTLDNRRGNLRGATHSQQMCNRRKHKDSKTGFKGVTFNKKSGKFHARINKDGQYHWVGQFTAAEEAHTAYCAAATKLHGEFARFN